MSNQKSKYHGLLASMGDTMWTNTLLYGTPHGLIIQDPHQITWCKLPSLTTLPPINSSYRRAPLQ